MRNRRSFLLAAGLLLWSVLAYGQLRDQPIGVNSRAVSLRSLGQSSLYFIENHGQVAGPARYYVRGRDRTVFVGDDALTVVLQPGSKHSSGNPFALRLEFVGARPNPLLRGEGKKGPVINQFTGGREKWRRELPTYSRLVYTDLWPGIDLALVGDVQHIKYEFRVEPGADPGQIRLRYRGGDTLRIEPTGDLAIDTPLGTLRDQRPISFQESGGKRTEVSTQYTLAAAEDGTYGFALAGYDRTKPLVIDPAIFVYASYLGGAGEDRGSVVAVDRFGAAYISGITTSTEASFPTGSGFGSLAGFDKNYDGGLDVFVAKVLPSGEGLEYVTYLGGSGNDVPAGIAVDAAGCAYVAGYTNNGTFPVVGGPGTSYNGGTNDVFVFKLNSSGTALVYSGFIGGTGDDREPAIALDGSGSAYITGLTYSSQATFPTGTGFGSLPGADHSYNGDSDAFLIKVRPDGSGLQGATYIGGSGFDNGYAIGVDAAGDAYVGGNTASHENTFPDGDGVGGIPGPNTTYVGGPFDAFVVKLSGADLSFSYVAFVGGTGEDRYASALAVTGGGSAWIGGRTDSTESTFPTGHGFGGIPGFDRTHNGGLDAFAVRINSSGTAFDYATYLGGSGDDEIVTMAVGSDGNAHFTGRTNSTEATFPDGDGFGNIPGPDRTYNGGPHDAYLVELNTAGTGIAYATYIGGPGGGFYDELGSGVAVDGNGDAYVVGYTTSGGGFPGGSGFGSIPGFDQSYNGGPADAFIVKISAEVQKPPYSVDASTIAYWRFEEAAGATVADATGHHSGTTNGATTVVDGRFGKARSYQSIAGDYITVPDTPTLTNLSQLSIEAWVFPASCSFYREEIVEKGAQIEPYNYYNLGLFGCPNGDGIITFHFEVVNHGQSPGEALAQSSIRHPIQQWYYLAGTYDGVRAKLYVNGVLEATSPNGPAITITTHDPLFIHNHTFQNGQSNGRMGGIIDEVRISKIARQPAEIVAAYSGSPPPTIPVDAGDDATILAGTPVSLNGSTSATGCTPAFSWRFVGRPATSTEALSGADTPTPSFTPDVQGVYTAELVVSCGTGFGKDVVQISATTCTGQALQVFPSVSQPLLADQQQEFVGYGGSEDSFSWSLLGSTDGELSTTTGKKTTYRARSTPGTDTLRMHDVHCGDVDVPIVVAVRPGPEPNGPPRLSRNPTQGETSVTVYAAFNAAVDNAEVCVDAEDSPQPGTCRRLDVTGAFAQGQLHTAPSNSTDALAFGSHGLRVRGETGGLWGQLSAPARLDVAEQVAILLINGYNFCSTGPHPDQWWSGFRDNDRTIPCQIRDYFFYDDQPTACPPGGSGVNCDSNVAPVCVVDNIDGREQIFDDDQNGITGTLTQLENYISADPWLDSIGHYILIGHSYGGQIARAYATAHPEKVVAVVTMDTPHAGAKWFLPKLKSILADIQETLQGCPLSEHEDRALQIFTRDGAEDLSRRLNDEKWSSDFGGPFPPIHAIALQGAHCPPPIYPQGVTPGPPHCAFPQPTGDDNIVTLKSQLGIHSNLLADAFGWDWNDDFIQNRNTILPADKFGLNGCGRLYCDLHNSVLSDRDTWRQVIGSLKEVLGRYRNVLGSTAISVEQQLGTRTSGSQVTLPARYEEQVVGVFQGVLTAGAPTAEASFEIEAADDFTVTLTTQKVSPNVRLVRPNGSDLAPTQVNGLTTLFTLWHDAEGNHQTFFVRQPETGRWKLSFAASVNGGGAHVPATGASWAVTVSVRSPLSLTSRLMDSSFLPGEQVDIVSNLLLGSAGIPGAVVTAVVTPSGGGPTSSVTLFDDGSHDDEAPGDGIYGGSVLASGPGESEVTISASGGSLLGTFERQQTTSFLVGAQQASIGGGFNENAPDSDDNGSYDSLNWNFPVRVAVGGTYTCTGDLEAADGSVVSHSFATFSAPTAGDYQVTLSFSGRSIYKAAKLGPYTLTNLKLTVGTPSGEMIAGRPLQVATSSGPYWSWLSFERFERPIFVWSSPIGDQVTTGNSTPLGWNIADGNGATTLDLYYDTTGSGFSGTPIITDLATTQGTMTYTWDMTGLPDGVYFVYARVRNGEYSDAIYGGSIRRLLDSDGDGTPDAWENAHGLNPSSSADTYLDPDGDGLSNFDEYPNGTDPQESDTDGGGESDLSEAVNGRDGTSSGDDVTSVTLATVSPGEGDSRGGEQVLVLGSGFQSGATVDFGGAAAPEVIFINSTRLIVTTPAHALGTADVTVTNPGGGSGSKAGAFAFLCEFVEPPVAFSNAASSPLCPGQDLQLGTSGISGATFSWTGPNGFTSSLQNPTISQATSAASGTYTVTMQIGSCSLQAATDVLVRSLPTAMVSGDQTICPESSASIQANLTGEPPWSLEWSDGLTQSGITTSPVTRLVSPTTDTTYFVTSISDSHCGGIASGSAAVTVHGNCTMFHTLTPCRVLDTRGPAGDNGGPALAGGATRVFTLGGKCGIPATAKAVALNVTVSDATRPGHLRLYPGGDPLPGISTINFVAGQTRANNAIVRLGAGGTLAIFAGQPSGDTVQAIVDVTGFFE